MLIKGGLNSKQVFYNFCQKASEERTKINMCFVIDEINRAKCTLFGEVMNLMEDKEEESLKQQKQQLDFCIHQM